MLVWLSIFQLFCAIRISSERKLNFSAGCFRKLQDAGSYGFLQAITQICVNSLFCGTKDRDWLAVFCLRWCFAWNVFQSFTRKM